MSLSRLTHRWRARITENSVTGSRLEDRSPIFLAKLFHLGSLFFILQNPFLHPPRPRGVLPPKFRPLRPLRRQNFPARLLDSVEHSIPSELTIRGLRPGILSGHHDPRRAVAKIHRRRYLVHMLTTRTRTPSKLFLKVSEVEPQSSEARSPMKGKIDRRAHGSRSCGVRPKRKRSKRSVSGAAVFSP